MGNTQKKEDSLQGSYVNYKETKDKREVFKWIDKAAKESNISEEKKKRIDAIVRKSTILNIPAAERRKDPYACYAKLKYDEIWEIAGICGVTIYDFLQDLQVSCPKLMPEGVDEGREEYADRRRYLPKDVSDLYRMCDELTEENRRKALLTAKSLCPVVFQSNIDDGFAIVKENDFIARESDGEEDNTEIKAFSTLKARRFNKNPSRKIYWIMRRKELKLLKRKDCKDEAWGEEDWAIELFRKISKGKEWEKPIHLEDIPDVAVCLDVSLHELFCAPDSLFLYATKPYTESIVSAYYFMSPQSKRTFADVVSCLYKLSKME